MPEVEVNGVVFDPKYLVCKISDLKKHLSTSELETMTRLMNKVMRGRVSEGKTKSNNYLVINSTESYASAIAEIMRLHGHYKETNI
jgi:hypothetical protein